MSTASDIDPFDEHYKIDLDMKKLQEELMQLCKKGLYDEAERRAREELVPLHKRWLETLNQSFINIRAHPNFYKPK